MAAAPGGPGPGELRAELRAELTAELRAGLQALGMSALDTDMERLIVYLELLAKWNRAYNLSAIREPAQMLRQHLLDCLAALPALDRVVAQRAVRVLDVGSGAGLPGLVWALMRPSWRVFSVDAVAKKASFVRQAAAELVIGNLRSEHVRVEVMQAAACDLIVSRAFASLADFTRLTRKHLAPGGCWVAMKGKVPDLEIAALGEDVQVFHVEQLQVPGLQAQRCLVWMRAPEPQAKLG